MASSHLQTVLGQAVETRQISTPFDGIWIQSYLSVTLTIGEAENSVRVEGSIADIKNIETVVEDGHLIIHPINQDIPFNSMLQIQVRAKYFTELIAAGSSVINFMSKVPVSKCLIIVCDSACLTGSFTGDNFGILASESGSVFVTVFVKSLAVQLNNAGGATVIGLADQAVVRVDGGAGVFHGQNLVVYNLLTELKGSGKVKVQGTIGNVESCPNGWVAAKYSIDLKRYLAIQSVVEMGFTVEQVLKAVDEWSKHNPQQEPTEGALTQLLLDFSESATVGSTFHPPFPTYDSAQCVICMDNSADIVFLPCRHLKTCAICAQSVEKCPVCRQIIADRMQVYL